MQQVQAHRAVEREAQGLSHVENRLPGLGEHEPCDLQTEERDRDEDRREQKEARPSGPARSTQPLRLPEDQRHELGAVAALVATKIVAYTWMIVLPLMFLDITWWQFLIGFVTAHATAGIILGVIFQLAHVVEGPDFPRPDDEGVMEHAWLVHQMRTTANFAEKNHLLSWYVGGLNFQIEHHLFPRTCSIHYPAIAPIVRRVAAEHGVPYHYNATLREAAASHYRMLKQLGDGTPAAASAAVA